jgi:adenylate cyclase
MAFFGAPKMDETHPIQAVQAAIEMLKRLDQMNARNIWKEPLKLRIAINTGPSFVGDVGSSQRVDYTVLGSAVNLASRMESVCEPGECLISKSTYDRIDKYQKLFFPVGEGRFRGIDRPVMIYQTKRQRTRGKLN